MESNDLGKNFMEHTGIDLVNVYVGKEEAHLRLHKKLLCARSPFFRAAFTGQLKEAQSSTIKLPEDSVEAFNVVVAWMYSDVVPAGATKLVLCNAYRLGEKFLTPGLQNAIIKTFADHMKANRADLPDQALMQQLYRDVDKEHPLARFWTDWVVYGLWSEPTAVTKYDELIAESPSFAVAMLHKFADLTSKLKLKSQRPISGFSDIIRDTEDYYVKATPKRKRPGRAVGY
ncbi:MAG: hypothetical protein M1815_000160 [Lichina confinis]|nr:MAG: hypothetical protein M1815_000160 [Lichina confinis]